MATGESQSSLHGHVIYLKWHSDSANLCLVSKWCHVGIFFSKSLGWIVIVQPSLLHGSYPSKHHGLLLKGPLLPPLITGDPARFLHVARPSCRQFLHSSSPQHTPRLGEASPAPSWTFHLLRRTSPSPPPLLSYAGVGTRAPPQPCIIAAATIAAFSFPETQQGFQLFSN